MGNIPNGIVERVDDGYVGYCYEVGTTARGTTVEEAFANLNRATWLALQERETTGATADEDAGFDIMYFPADGDESNGAALAAMTTILLEGLGEHDMLRNEQPAA